MRGHTWANSGPQRHSRPHSANTVYIQCHDHHTAQLVAKVRSEFFLPSLMAGPVDLTARWPQRAGLRARHECHKALVSQPCVRPRYMSVWVRLVLVPVPAPSARHTLKLQSVGELVDSTRVATHVQSHDPAPERFTRRPHLMVATRTVRQGAAQCETQHCQPHPRHVAHPRPRPGPMGACRDLTAPPMIRSSGLLGAKLN